jgi:hypothetical protein
MQNKVDPKVNTQILFALCIACHSHMLPAGIQSPI